MALKALNWSLFVILTFIFIYCEQCESAKILGIFHIPSKSHHILGSKLLKSLAENGHQVTMVSPYPFEEKVTNYTDIFLEEMLDFKTSVMQQFISYNNTFLTKIKFAYHAISEVSEIVLKSPQVEALGKEHFDLVIQIGILGDAFLGLAHRLKAPVIYLSTVGSNTFINSITGNPAPPSFVPTMMLPTPSPMTLWQRVSNTFFYLFFELIMSPGINYFQQRLLSKYFPEAPPLSELMHNVSLVFLNSHYSIESPRPYLPNMIQIGGFHIEKPKELEPELRKYLDSASEGAIFLSFGSNVLISSIDKKKVDVFVKSLGKLPYKVLLKSDIEIPNLPKNIRLGKWLPQNDILAHPNLRLFISHGGLLSTTEAVYHGVPILGIPFFADQQMNIADAVHKGYAVGLEMSTLTEETFNDALAEILDNPKYRETIELKSSLLRNQPIAPLDLALYWVEHVLRHRGGSHLRNDGIKLYTYQYLLLDVFAIFGLALLVVSWIMCYVTRLCVRGVKCIFKKEEKVKRQ